MSEIGGLRIKTLSNIALGNPRCAMTYSAMCREMVHADQKPGGVIESRWYFYFGGVSLDRSCACRLQNPARDRPVGFACRYVKKTGVDEGEPTNDDKGHQDGERDQKAAHAHRLQNQTRTPKAKRKSPVLSPACFA